MLPAQQPLSHTPVTLQQGPNAPTGHNNQPPQVLPATYSIASSHPTTSSYDMTVSWTHPSQTNFQDQSLNVMHPQMHLWPSGGPTHLQNDHQIGSQVPMQMNSCPETHPPVHQLHHPTTHYVPQYTTPPATSYSSSDFINNISSTVDSGQQASNVQHTSYATDGSYQLADPPNVYAPLRTTDAQSVASIQYQDHTVPTSTPIHQDPYKSPVVAGPSTTTNYQAEPAQEGIGSLEDALEVIKSHAECISGRLSDNNTPDEDDTSSRTGGEGGSRRSGGKEIDRGRRQANNTRERIRVKDINDAFKELGSMCDQHMNVDKSRTKLSTLHDAAELITHLERAVKERNLNPKGACLS